METTSASAMLVEPRDLRADLAAVTATIPRSQIEAALSSDFPAELYLDVRRSDEAGAEERTVSVAWERADLERLLADAKAAAITFSFAHDDLERAFEEPDVEGHGLRERALILTVAAAAATGASAASAAAASDPGTGSNAAPIVAQVSHGEAMTASQLGVGTPTHDEAGLLARGIQGAPAHDEATLVSRGIEAPSFADVSHGEALTASQFVATPGNDESSLAARGIELTPVHDEATLVSRGIEAPPAVHDEATLISRGIEAPQITAIHDEASLISRGIAPASPATGDSGFELPTIDAPAAAVTAGLAGGIALLITAAGFSARRGRGGVRPA